jgi:ADP-ribose pyrophosphatase YjhB (NUDIX family)
MKATIRVAGIWISNGKVLLESLADREVWGIPGGSLEAGESLEAGCQREYREETEIEMTCVRLALVHEHFWQDDGSPILEYGFYFVVEPTNLSDGSRSEVKSLEGHLIFRWFDLGELPGIEFVPKSIRQSLAELGTQTVFVSTREGYT